MSTVAERVADAVAPLVADLGLVLHDVEHAGTSIRVFVDRDGGVDLAALTAATRAVSHKLDELDPIGGHYTLEVSSPGLERPLRTPAHFSRAIGSEVSVKTVAGTDGERRQQRVAGDAPLRSQRLERLEEVNVHGQAFLVFSREDAGPLPGFGAGPQAKVVRARSIWS